MARSSSPHATLQREAATSRAMVFKEEKTLKKVAGLFICGGLLTACLWWTHPGSTAVRAAAETEPAVRRSAQDLFKAGKAAYLQGRYAESVQLLESAHGRNAELHDTERTELDTYLTRARLKLDELSQSEGLVARGQSQDRPYTRGTPPGRPAPGADPRKPAGGNERPAAEKLMSEAKALAARGDFDAAAQKALQAKTFKVQWRSDEQTPTAFLQSLAALEKRKSQGKAPPGEQLFSGKPSQPLPGSGMGPGMGATRPSAAAPKMKDSQVSPAGAEMPASRTAGRRIPVQLETGFEEEAGGVVQAGASQAQGEEEEIVQVAGKTPEIYRGGARDGSEASQTPTAARAVTAKTPTAAKPAPVASRTPAPATSAPGNSARTAPRTSPMVTSTDALRMRADMLVKRARQAFDAGRLDEAQRLAKSAQRLQQEGGLTYGADEDSPAMLLTEVGRQKESQATAQAEKAAEEEVAANETIIERAPVAKPKMTPEPTPEEEASESIKPKAVAGTGRKPEENRLENPARQQALGLLQEARTALEEGRLDEAKEKSQKARAMDVVYGAFDDRPELLLADVDRASRTGMLAKSKIKPMEEPAAEVTAPAEEEAPVVAATEMPADEPAA